VNGDPTAVSPAVELAVYRIVQESLTNVLRHAGPRVQARVEVEITESTVTVTVDDDGRGPAALEFHDGSGTGIAGMRERVGAFGGHLDAGPGPTRGWRVRAVVPLASRIEARQ
jgi:signal transduction histidine kinase